MKNLILAGALVLATASSAHAQALIQFDFGPPPQRGSFWDGVPPTLQDRLHLVDVRMQRLRSAGILNDAEWASDREEFNHLNVLVQELPRFEGGTLSAREHNWLWGRLNNLANKLHWQAQLGF
jgi:hypothetical protein